MFVCWLCIFMPIRASCCSCSSILMSDSVGIGCEACCSSNEFHELSWWLWRQHGHSPGFGKNLWWSVCICLFEVWPLVCFSGLLRCVWHVLCFFYLPPQGENEGVHSNRLYHGSVMINKTNSTLTPLSISHGSITALWDVFAWTDTLVLLTLCVFVCNVAENAAVISADQTVCLCLSYSQTHNAYM